MHSKISMYFLQGPPIFLVDHPNSVIRWHGLPAQILKNLLIKTRIIDTSSLVCPFHVLLSFLRTRKLSTAYYAHGHTTSQTFPFPPLGEPS